MSHPRVLIVLSANSLPYNVTKSDFDAWVAWVAAHVDEACRVDAHVDQFAFAGGPAEDTVRAADDEVADAVRNWLSYEGWESFCADPREGRERKAGSMSKLKERDIVVAGAEGTAIAGNCGTAVAGNGGTATAGVEGTAVAGVEGTAVAGDGGTAMAGHRGKATAGDYGTATAIAYGKATAGNGGTATAGVDGTATVGVEGTATAGDYGKATAGNGGAATAGYGGTAKAGKMGEIRVRWHDGTRDRTAVGYVGEDGIEANVAYKVLKGKLVKA